MHVLISALRTRMIKMKFVYFFCQISAGAECQFSDLKMIKTQFRDRLDPETISDLMYVKRAIPDPNSWEIPNKENKKVEKVNFQVNHVP